MPHFKSNNVDQTRPKIELILQKIAKSSNTGGFAPRPPMASGIWGLRPLTKKLNPPIANF